MLHSAKIKSKAVRESTSKHNVQQDYTPLSFFVQKRIESFNHRHRMRLAIIYGTISKSVNTDKIIYFQILQLIINDY